MRLYVSSLNGVLDEYKSQIHQVSPLEAEKLVMWQACEGSWGLLAKTCKQFFPKPIYVMQHGRGSSRDYLPPLSKTFYEDVYLAWGKYDYDIVKSLGREAVITGCPLNGWIKPKVQHKEKVILFVPVNTGKEEPDNILVYQELLKIKANAIQANLKANYDDYRAAWKDMTRAKAANDFTVLTKVLPWHDQKFYTEGVLKGFQDSEKNNRLVFDLLRNVDLVVGLDEGTTELFALAHDVPVIVVDGFEYRWTEGKFKQPPTPGFKHCSLEDLAKTVDEYLAKPELDREARLLTAENEMTLSIKDPVKRLHEIIGS